MPRSLAAVSKSNQKASTTGKPAQIAPSSKMGPMGSKRAKGGGVAGQRASAKGGL